MWHGYIGFENIALTAQQKQTFVAGLQALGPSHADNGAYLNHMRVRLDNDAAIFEALFDEDQLTVLAWRQRLADIFGVAVANITASTQQTQYGPVVTFVYQSTNRLRGLLFGGVGTDWQESNAACRAYLAANSAAWESVP